MKTERCKVGNEKSAVYLLIVMLTALLSASNDRRSHIISAVAPPSFYTQEKKSNLNITKEIEQMEY